MPNTNGDVLKLTGFGGLPVLPVNVFSSEYPHPLEISEALMARTRTKYRPE